MKTKVQYRNSDVCPGCGEAKAAGLLVCWPCFKYREDIMSLKYFVELENGTFWDWLKIVPQTWKVKIAQGQ